MLNGTNNAASLLDKLDDSKRTVAKLMARENITIQVVAGAKTATFDTVRRVLTIPDWQSLTIDQFDHLIAHEVAHALFSNDHEWIAEVIKDRGLKTYFNVVEDARIERKMLAQYPGLKRIFYNSYQQFSESGPLFLTAGRKHLVMKDGTKVAIAKMKLIDRINLFYKIGAFVDIPFSAEERTWIEQINRCYDQKSALAVAKKLHKLAREKKQEDKKQEETKPEPKQNPTPQPEPEETDADDSQDDSQDEESTDDSEESDSEESDDTDEDADATDEDAESESDAAESESSDEESDEESSEETDNEDAGEESDEDSDVPTESDAAKSDEDADSDDEGEAQSSGSDEESDEDTDEASDDYSDGASDSDAGDEVSETVEDAEETLNDLAQEEPSNRETLRHVIIAPLRNDIVKSRTVTASEYSDLVTKWATEHSVYDYNSGKSLPLTTTLDAKLTEWENKYLATAKAMSMDFDRRKNARESQRAMTAKTGRLDMTKLHQYKYTEDLFLRSVTMPRGQSHGIVMIIDASGSMERVFRSVLDQVLLFAHFAHASKIPFEAYMFTDRRLDHYKPEASEDVDVSMGLHTLTVANSGKLIGLVNTATDRNAFKKQVRTVLALQSAHSGDYNFSGVPYAALGGTPLYTGMLLAERHVERMKRTLRLDKMVFVVVTDGGDGNGLQFEQQTVQPNGDVTREMTGAGYLGLIVRDAVTKRNHVIAESSVYSGRTYYTPSHNGMTSLLLNTIKDRHNASTIYMYLMETQRRKERSVRGLNDAASMMRTAASNQTNRYAVTESELDAIMEDGQFILPKTEGIADLNIVIPTAAMELKEDNFKTLDTENMSQKRIAKLFAQSMTKRISHRKFVNAIIPVIA